METILIVDDDVHIQKLLKRLLESAGYRIMIADDGIEALEQYKDNVPDLVIMDIVMPNKEGIETIIELKKRSPDAKIIAMTGGGNFEPGVYLKIAEKCGAANTLEKPIDRDELLSKVEITLQNND